MPVPEQVHKPEQGEATTYTTKKMAAIIAHRVCSSLPHSMLMSATRYSFPLNVAHGNASRTVDVIDACVKNPSTRTDVRYRSRKWCRLLGLHIPFRTTPRTAASTNSTTSG